MAERVVHITSMRPENASMPGPQPQTRNELQEWVRQTLRLPPALEGELLAAIDAVFTRHERLWQESKHEAIQALSSGFADKMARVQTELSSKDALGHAVGDQIIERVAQILREQARSDDLIAQERLGGPRTKDLHARFGGDEFCFLIPDLADYHQAHTVGERFRDAVERFDWALEDRRLAVQPPRVDVGVVCLWLGRVAERRFIASRLAADLIQRADKLMYEAKGERASHIYLLRAKIENGELVEIADGVTEP